MTQTNEKSSSAQNTYTDAELIKHFPGFKNNYPTINGVTLHYVEGGSGMPLICLPGWPQTWYSYPPVYAAAYNDADSIRASNGWYQTFGQDIEDAKTYQQLTMPVLGIGSYISYNYMKMGMSAVASNLKMIEISDSGHYLYEEQPEQVIDAVLSFLAV